MPRKYIKKAKKKPSGDNFYRIPRDLYLKGVEDAEDFDVYYTLDKVLANRCHSMHCRHFTAPEPVNTKSYFMEAMSQALDDRNFRVLYEIINKALDDGDNFLTQQAHEYMYRGIMADPLIENKDEVLQDFITRVKMLKMSVKEYHEMEHSLKPDEKVIKRQRKVKIESDSDSDSD